MIKKPEKPEVIKKAKLQTEDAEAISTKRRVLLGIGLPAWVLAAFVASGFLVGLIIAILFQIRLITVSVEDPILNSVVFALVFSLAISVVIWIPYKLFGIRTTKEELGLTKLPSWSDILLAPAGFVVYIILAAILMTIVTRLIPGFDAEQEQNVGFDAVSKSYEYILAFITLVIVAPIAEEVLMRGYLYGKLRKFVPVIAAMLISSVLFAAMHQQWNVAVNVFPLAIVLVVLREMTGSIWAGILLHALKNGVAYYFLFVNPTFLNTIVG